jgi:hypothetical protein
VTVIRRLIGHSHEGRPIEVFVDDAPGPRTLLIGGFHGDEPATVELVRTFVPAVPGVARLPVLNPDGALRVTRYNARGVDLNRNFAHRWRADSEEPPGPEPWSEPESRALRDFILAWQPAKIVALHWALGEIDADGEQSTPLAEAMWAALNEAESRPYRLRTTGPGRVEADCPGSLGQWAGFGLTYRDGSRPAMITLELPWDPDVPRTEPLPPDHFADCCARWQRDAEGYLAGVRRGVEKMLHAACAPAV